MSFRGAWRGLTGAMLRPPRGLEKGLSKRKTCTFRQVLRWRNLPFSAPSTERRQGTQRLWKALHRDDPQPVRVALRVARVLPSRDEEGIHMRLARADRLLLDPADGADGAVREDLARRGDPVAVDDVPPELLEDVEREGEPRRGAADAARVDADRDRQPDVERGLEEDADDRTPRLRVGRDRLDPPHERR